MGKFRAVDRSPGRQNRENRELRRQIREANAARRLPGSTFPTGSIPASALVAPTAPGFVSLTATNFAVTAAGGAVLTGTVTVPPGMTAVVAGLTGRVYAVNPTASVDFLLARVEVDTLTGNALPVRAAAAGTGDDSPLNVATLAVMLNNLTPGATFGVRVWAKTTAAWAANSGNTADLSGSLAWFA